jgi:hypothetical protein
MNPLNGLKVGISIDGISLSCSPQSEDVFLPDTIGAYQLIRHFKDESTTDKNRTNQDRRCENYRWRLIYEHRKSHNLLMACTKRKPMKKFIPPLYLHFFSSYVNPLSFREVRNTLRVLENSHGIDLSVSQIDLAIDLIHPRKINLHSRVSRAINPMKKREVKLINDTTTLVMGAHGSSHRVTHYDKGQQLIDRKKITIPGDISRIEIRLRPRALSQPVKTISDLREKGWASSLYGRYFSLDRPQQPLKVLLGKKLASKPIWKLREIMNEGLGRIPENFCRDYIREHSRFGPAVRKALAEFKWD